MSNSLDKLIGFQIVSVDDEKFVLAKGDKTITLTFETDDGDCCGYAHISTNMYFEPYSDRNPIITNVERQDEEEAWDCHRCSITFYGEQQQLATIESEAGSGSGWRYGATATMFCSDADIDIDQTLASW